MEKTMMRYLLRYTYSLTILLIIFITPSGEVMSEETATLSNINEIPESVWNKIAEKKIYFGHQSVGYNLLDGIRDLMAENPLIKLKLVETRDSANFNAPLFAHSTVGENENPQTKINDFTDVLEKGVGEKADIAFFKFCYLDFRGGVDPEKIFNQYKVSVSNLQEKYPGIKLIHSTVPLTSQQTGPKAWVKKIIGKPLRGFDGNIKRNEFNDLMRAEYNKSALVFDLAKIESTATSGERASFNRDNSNIYTLVPEFTDDGSHLNETGRKIVANDFLFFLANLVDSPYLEKK
jgi:predicted HAD superfamily Cof-like phosphohydrolase